MHSYAGDITALLEADLRRYGWHGSVEPYPEDFSDHRMFSMVSLRRSLFKKFHNKQTDDERDRKALSKFLKVNEECANYQPSSCINELMAIALGEAKDFIHRSCYDYNHTYELYEPLVNLYKIEPYLGFGPGANIGARSGDPYGKLSISRLTYTDPALLVLFQHVISGRGSTWIEQEQFRSKHFPTEMVQGSRLTFVPKSTEITRTICTEPILNMFFQKGIAALLRRKLNEVAGIDLSQQPERNKELARRGSITGKFGTIDLSSASDSMSLTLVREWFPPEFVFWLELTRCKQTTLKSGQVIDLHMVSSMGNDFTFPLQTLFFTSLVYGAYRALDIPFNRPGTHKIDRNGDLQEENFAVFGDDIIIDYRAYGLVVRMLSHCGFTVNVDKSFNEGPFRESCGSDWLSGHNVRGVYLQKLLDDMDFYSAYNRLIHWCSRTGIYLESVLTYLKKQVGRVLYVPLHEDMEAGFMVPVRLARCSRMVKGAPHGNLRYTYARRKQCLVKMPADESEITPFLLRKIRRKIPHWRYSPAGILLLLMHGNLRDGRLLLRDDGGTAEYLKRVSPCWDYLPSARSERPGFAERFHSLSSLVWYDEVTSP